MNHPSRDTVKSNIIMMTSESRDGKLEMTF